MELLREIDATFRIAVIGDFLAEASLGAEGGQASWIPRRATPDTLMGLLGFRPSLRVAGPGERDAEEIRFSGLEDFRPEKLFHRLGRFAPYRQVLQEARTERPSPPPPQPGGGVLDAILDVAEPPSEDTLPRDQEELEAFVRAVVRPHLVRPDEEGPKRLAQAEEAVSAPISSLLHQPDFQALESIWRSLVFLLSRVDTSGKVRVYAVNVPREALEKDLLGRPDLSGARLLDLLTAPDLGAATGRWSLVVGAYSFSLKPGDIDLLARIASLANEAQVPWLSSLAPAASGGSAASWPDRIPTEWQSLRRRPESTFLALTYPRFLVREPYGGGGRLTKGLRYRETVSSPDHLLWGYGAFLKAALMAQGFAAQGRGFRDEDWAELGGMAQAQPWSGKHEAPVSTEADVDVHRARQILESGVAPLVPFPARAAIRLGWQGSVSAANTPLAGWWRK